MRIAALNQFYWPDLAATSQLLTDACEHWAAKGHDVHVVTGRARYAGGHDRPPAEERHKGVHIHRVWSSELGKRTLLHRGADALSFQGGALAALLRLPRPDVIVAKTSPPLIASLGFAARTAHRCKMVYWVQDLYPDVAVALGAVPKDSPLAKGSTLVARTLASRSDALIALGPRMREVLVEHGAALSRVHVVDNWADGDVIRPRARAHHPLREQWGVGERLCVMYSGNFGMAHDFDTLLAAMTRLADRDDVFLALVGDGSKKKDVEHALRDRSNVKFLPLFPREELGLSLTAADVHLVSLHPAMDGLVVPSKVYGVMAAGRPTVYVGPRGSDVWRLLEHTHAGRSAENGDVPGVVDAVAAYEDAAVREETGRRAREAYDAGYDKGHALQKLDAVLQLLV